MSENEIELPQEESAKQEEAPKKKRAYTRRKQAEPTKAIASPAPSVPELPNPAILALQEDILGIVKQRSAAQQAIGHATQAMNQANANLQAAREYLASLEQEVQYRMNLINQMKGAPASINVPSFSIPQMPVELSPYGGMQVNAYPSDLSGPVGSIPPPPRQAAAPNFGGAGIRSESASGFRDQEFQTRAAI